MEVKSPIFIIGAGRSGSTIFQRMFCAHTNVAWFTRFHAKYKSNIEPLKYLTYIGDFPIVGPRLRSFLDPGEFYEIWELTNPGFSTPCRDLQALDVTNKNRKNIISLLSKIVTKRKNRPLIKLTGWPRVGFLKEIFPDAKFIHVIRDGRAVANSTMQVNFWWGWRGPYNWRWGNLDERYNEEWIKHEKSFVALAGIQWKILMDSIAEVRKHVDDRNFLEVQYESLCKDPINVFKDVVDFCELEWTGKFEKDLARFSLRSQDFKWSEDLTDDQKNILEGILSEHLKRHKYL